MNLGKPYLEDLFNKQIRFVIPVFQRHYVWNETEQWAPLWEDFLNKFNERINNQKYHSHYTGSIVLYHESTTTSTISTYSVIDGQQRLTTFQLFIAAFREVCRKFLEDESLIKELNKFLLNDKSFGDKNYDKQKFKLVPTKFNKEVFMTILTSTYDEVEEILIRPILHEYGYGHKTYRDEAKRRSRILAAYLFFYEQLIDLIDGSDLDLYDLVATTLLVIKRDFQFVEIGLTSDDDPQMIFETMNGRGAALTETDLIRNYIFMRANNSHESLDKIYEDYWDEFDDPNSDFKWHDKIKRGRNFGNSLQFFMIDYLTLKLKTEIRYDQVFYHYKHFVVNQEGSMTLEEELRELKKYSIIYKRLIKPSENSAFERLANRLLDMDISTIYPLLLYIECEDKILIDEKEKIYKYLDSYITRRFLCGMTTKNYNNVFLEYLKFIAKHKDAEQFKNHLLAKTAETNVWPSDTLLKEKLMERSIYREERNRSRSISNILLEIEKMQRTRKQEKVTFSNTGLTIEHVLPQKWYEYWSLDEGYISEEDFNKSAYAVLVEEDTDGLYHRIEHRNKMLHTIGNLTILTDALNPSISNSEFSVKQKEIANQSTLILNTYFNGLSKWDEDDILKRSEIMYELIRQNWSR